MHQEPLTVFAPCRLGLAGGGTDLPSYAATWSGAVVSVTLNLGATVTAAFADDIYIELQDFGVKERYRDADELREETRPAFALAAAAVTELRPAGKVALTVRTGLPPGSGLGTSGAVGVAACYALHLLNTPDSSPDPGNVAERASVIEIDRVGRPIGRQDQYAAAFGGLNLWRFDASGVRREPLTLTTAASGDFAGHFMLFFSGRRRDSAEVLGDQRDRTLAGDAATLAALHRNKETALALAAAVRAGDWAGAGEAVHGSWLAKVAASGRVADERVVALTEAARARGAWAMKVSGAGAGGFYMVMAPPARHAALAAWLTAEGFRRYDFSFDERGVRELSPRSGENNA